jgi:hypothetical protein
MEEQLQQLQHMEEQLQHGPAEGFLEGLGAGEFESHELDYTNGVDADADMDAIGHTSSKKPLKSRRCS